MYGINETGFSEASEACITKNYKREHLVYLDFLHLKVLYLLVNKNTIQPKLQKKIAL